MRRLTSPHSIHISMKLRHIMAVLMSIAILVVLHAAGTPAFAAGFAPVSEEEREQRFQELSSRLELTEEQEPEVRSIIAQDRERRVALMRENGIDVERGERPSLFTMMGMRSDMSALNDQTRGDLSAILSDDQMDTYETIVSERRAEMRASFGR